MSFSKPSLALLVAAFAGLGPSRAWASEPALEPAAAEEPEPTPAPPRTLHLSGFFQHALRLHSKITHTRDRDARSTKGSWVTGANILSVSRTERVTQVTQAGGELGGGGAGLDGALGIALSHGWTLLPEAHTPFLRAAGQMRVQGNSEYYFSTFQLPVFELGYQYASRDFLFELAGEGGLVVDGRFRVRRTTDPTRGVALYGGHLLLSFHQPTAKLLLLTRLVRLNEVYPVDVLDLRLCTAALDFVHACTTVDYFDQSWTAASGTDWPRSILITGISIGLGLPLHRDFRSEHP